MQYPYLKRAGRACEGFYSSIHCVSPMAIYAIKRGDESNDRLQSRFKQQAQKSRLVQVLRKRKVHKKKPTKRLQRIRALKREGYRAENKKNQFYSNR